MAGGAGERGLEGSVLSPSVLRPLTHFLMLFWLLLQNRNFATVMNRNVDIFGARGLQTGSDPQVENQCCRALSPVSAEGLRSTPARESLHRESMLSFDWKMLQ